uniref:Uncharacterized protein n=1 Tax=Timema cristinae TaxID=61476 RepID=A0A7R9CNX7_TIMCR|nr:unnamed protein product [Timema cristinae]
MVNFEAYNFLITKSKLQFYSSKLVIIETLINALNMPNRRLRSINSTVHISSERPEITHTNKCFYEEITIDESLMKFKRPLVFVQYNPSKRTLLYNLVKYLNKAATEGKKRKPTLFGFHSIIEFIIKLICYKTLVLKHILFTTLFNKIT